ncbi:efflux RND transporter periplasmic adaptor subunit [Pleionea sediminis]|uniref:efflux RND transporter periplasmic adaptor subunit n=1 Tax=Pleionea sediminis TaxID=2569479 RepID=UPI001186E9E2|nr:HlyD family efflux transporter periplasmic adaptor subunit [Pleionea sediminis]
MDIVRKKKVSIIQKYRWWLTAFTIILGVVLLAPRIVNSEYELDSQRLVFGNVEHGVFEIKVRGPGVLTPKDIRWISSPVEGRAERVLVKPGAIVSKGDVLMILSNPLLQRQLEETQWELEALEAEHAAASVELETRLLDQQAAVLNAKLNYQSAAMRLKAEETLIKRGTQAVSQLDYEKTKLEVEQYKARVSIEQQRLAKVTQNVTAQTNARKARLNKMKKTLERVQEQVNNLSVKASIDSVVQDVAIESGQQVVLGSNLAKLARQDELIAEVQIPEISIGDVTVGQKAQVDTRKNKIIGTVTRVAPSVNNGTVQVDIEFDVPLPSDARPDLSIDAVIMIAEKPNALFVRRPSFAQSNKVTQVFKVTQSGIAEKTTVNFGQGSVQYIEVVEGLKAGDRIIVSEDTEFKRFNKISIN